MADNSNELWMGVVKLFLDFAWKIFAIIGVIITILGSLTNFDLFKEHPLLVSFIYIVVTLIISLCYVIYKLVSGEIISKSSLDIAKEIERLVRHQYNEKNYLAVVRFGSAISRFLWLSSYSNQRIAVGKMVEDSASKIGRLHEQVSALIDDIGWTYFVIGDHEKAKQNILSGIEKAINGGLFYFAAKGKRHLAGIESSTGNKDKIVEHLNEAKSFIDQIPDASDKLEMEASLLLAEAEYLFENRNYQEAENNIYKAKKVLAKDSDRIRKVYSLSGNIYLAQHKYQDAKDEFNRGYNECKNIREDEFAKNAVGLAKIELQSGNLRNAKTYLTEAKEIFESGANKKELAMVDCLLRDINYAR